MTDKRDREKEREAMETLERELEQRIRGRQALARILGEESMK